MNSAWKRWPLQSSGHGFFGEPTAFLFLAQLAGFGHSLGDAFDEGLLGYKPGKFPMKFMWNSYLAWRYIKHQKNKRPGPSHIVQIGLPLIPVLPYRHFSTEGAIPCPPYTCPTVLPHKDVWGGPSLPPLSPVEAEHWLRLRKHRLVVSVVWGDGEGPFLPLLD